MDRTTVDNPIKKKTRSIINDSAITHPSKLPLLYVQYKPTP